MLLTLATVIGRAASSWRQLLLAAVLGAVAGSAASFLPPRLHKAKFSVVPQASADAGGIASIAARFGLSVGVGEPSQSIDFYAELLRARQTIEAVLGHAYADARGASTALVDVLDASGASEEKRYENAVEKLLEATTISASRKSNVLSVGVVLRDSSVALQVAKEYLRALTTFDTETRQLRGRFERQFVQGRLEEAESQLIQAEDSLLRFLSRNRDFSSSPSLQFEHDRLSRNVSFRAQVQSVLAQSLEQARIEEVRDTPMLTLVQPPYVPRTSESRRTALLAVGGAAAALLLVMLALLVRDHIRALPAEERERLTTAMHGKNP